MSAMWSGENRNKVFPVLPGFTTQQIGVSTSFSAGKNAVGEALYKMTIFIKYMKKGV